MFKEEQLWNIAGPGVELHSWTAYTRDLPLDLPGGKSAFGAVCLLKPRHSHLQYADQPSATQKMKSVKPH